VYTERVLTVRTERRQCLWVLLMLASCDVVCGGNDYMIMIIGASLV